MSNPSYIREKALSFAHQQSMLLANQKVQAFKSEDVIELSRQYEDYLTGGSEKNLNDLNRKQAAARAAHEAIRTLQIENKEPNVASPWKTVGQDIKESCYIGIDRVIENPNITSEALHDSWIVTKTEQGWTYGEVRSEEAKTHPCMVPYADLPPFQRLKDAMFRNVVKAVLGL